MEQQNKEILIGITIMLLTIAGLILLNYSQTFIISQTDLETTGVKSEVIIDQGGSYDLFSAFTIIDNTITFTIDGATKTYNSPAVFFMLDDSPTIYDTFQDIEEGTHTLKEYQIYIDFDKIHIKKWEKTYDVLIRTIYENITVANQTFYVDKPVNVTINNTVYVNQTVEKKVYVEPDLNAWVSKYKLQLIAVIGIALIYYLTKVRKRR